MTTIVEAPLEEQLRAFQREHPVKRRNDSVFWRAATGAEFAILLGVWEVVVGRLQLVDPAFLPPPSEIGAAFVRLLGNAQFLDNLLFSLENFALGVLLASFFGIGLGLVVGWSNLLDVMVAPTIWALYAIPKVAIAPLLILSLGLGPTSKIAMVFLMGFFPLVTNTMDGVRTADASLIRAARVFGLSGWKVATRVVLPATLPFVLVGLRRAVALGFVGEMLGEFLGSQRGLGLLLQRASFDFRMDDALAIVVVMVLVANSALFVVDLVRRRVAPWHDSAVDSGRA